MKKFLLKLKCLPITLVILITFFSYSKEQTVPVKRALIIAISNYPSGFDAPPTAPHWGHHLSCENDLKLLIPTLEHQGFSAENIDTLTDANATKKGIIKAIENLINKSNKGDIIVLHYSGHGQRIYDKSKASGYDASIIPYDAKVHWSNDYHGQNHLTGKEIGYYLNQLRRAVGPAGQVIVNLDCCYSGSGTRGPEKLAVRGGEDAFIPPDLVNNYSSLWAKFKLDTDFNYVSGDNQNLSPYVAIEATEPEQEDQEIDADGKGYGPLSYAFCEALQTKMTISSYRDLFAKILTLIKAKTSEPGDQTPTIEGDQDNLVFGTGVKIEKPYFKLNYCVNDNGKYVEISAGELQGIFDSTKISIYSTPDINASTVLATGTVYSTTPFTSLVSLNKNISCDVRDLPNYYAFVTSYSFSDFRIRVSVNTITDKNYLTSIKTVLSKFPLVIINDSVSDIVLQRDNNNLSRLNLKTSSGSKPFAFVIFNSIADSEALQTALRSFAQGNYLKNLNLQDTDYNIQIKLIPVHHYTQNYSFKNCAAAEKYTDSVFSNSIPAFQTGDTAIVLVKNTGIKLAYYNIVDIQPDGIVNPQVPGLTLPCGQEDAATDYKLDSGGCYILKEKIVEFSPPYGLETFKVFASKDPLDLRQVIGTRGTRGGMNSPMEILFKKTYDTRDAIIGNVSPTDAGGTSEYQFYITPPSH
jgi:metacaspase-1